MTSLADRARGVATGRRDVWLVPLLIALAALYPWYAEGLQDLPLIGDFVPSVGSSS